LEKKIGVEILGGKIFRNVPFEDSSEDIMEGSRQKIIQ